MIIKRIRKHAPRKKRPLKQMAAIINGLTSYVIDATHELLLDAEGYRGIANYVLDAQTIAGHGIEAGEKVDLYGRRNLEGDSVEQYQRQMLAANLLAPHAKDPIEHYVVSWKSGEVPSPDQIEVAIDIFAEELGYEDCQIVWATHSDTQNYHLHLVVNRIDLTKRKVVSAGGGWEIDRLHQVTALIEDRQAWEAEPNAIYKATAGVVIERSSEKIVRRADGTRDGCYKRRSEHPESGKAEAYSPINLALREAKSWQELHNKLAKLDASYRKKGSGAEIVIANQRMKASDFGREFARKRMEERLGKYQADVCAEPDAYELYQDTLRTERQRVRHALNATLNELRRRRKLAIRTSSRSRNAFESIVSEARLKLGFDLAESEVKRAFGGARRAVAEMSLRREAWLKAGRPGIIKVALPEFIFSDDFSHDQQIANVFGLQGIERGSCVEYRNAEDDLRLSDFGVVLIVHCIETSAIETALALAHSRGTAITVTGSAQFLQACREIAAKRGYKITGEDGVTLYSPPPNRRSQTEVPSVGRTRSPEQKNRQKSLREGAPTRKEMPAISQGRKAKDLARRSAQAKSAEDQELSAEVLWGAQQKRNDFGR